MPAIVFKTPGLIDPRAFTIIGLSSKPNSDNPIGRFGSGLKYAIAVLVRNKIGVHVWIGSTEYVFYTKAGKFRDQDFEEIWMRKTHVSLFDRIRGQAEHIQLPFTTQWGRDWELWQAFRELEANTRDELGQTFQVTGLDTNILPEPEHTLIVVYGNKFVETYADRERTFLPDGLTAVTDSGGLQIIDRPSQHVYYRSMRVMDLPKEKPSLMTYNFTREIDLTEDRTAAFPWQLERDIQAYVVAKEEDADRLKRITAAPKDSYEGGFNYDYLYTSPSPKFSAAAQQGSSGAAKNYAEGYLPKKVIPDPFAAHPRPWTLDPGESVYVLDANKNTIFELANEHTTNSVIEHMLKAINNYDYTKER